MESVNEIKEALSARSRTATLDELRSEGRRKVRLIRAEHVAAMVAEAVHAAIEQSGLIAPEEAQRLVERSRQEFRAILQQREQEARRAQEVEQNLAAREQELHELKQQFEQTAGELRDAQAELYRVRAQFESLQEQQREAAPAAGAPTELLLSLVQQMTNLKASLLTQQQPAAAAKTAGADFSAAIEKLAGSLNDRLEKLGKKMGVGAAVGGDAPVDFSGMFKGADQALESNLDGIEAKQKAGGGIASNLARLKKLKGGG